MDISKAADEFAGDAESLINGARHSVLGSRTDDFIHDAVLKGSEHFQKPKSGNPRRITVLQPAKPKMPTAI
jgi:hypothetical protein